MSSIASETEFLAEDYLTNQVCECGHSIEEHSGKCYGLDFNGSIWSSCNCKRFSARNYYIEVGINAISMDANKESE